MAFFLCLSIPAVPNLFCIIHHHFHGPAFKVWRISGIKTNIECRKNTTHHYAKLVRALSLFLCDECVPFCPVCSVISFSFFQIMAQTETQTLLINKISFLFIPPARLCVWGRVRIRPLRPSGGSQSAVHQTSFLLTYLHLSPAQPLLTD